MHIHEYSNVIERRASRRRRRWRGPRALRSAVDSIQNDEGQPRERIQIRAAQGPLLLLADHVVEYRGTARALYADPETTRMTPILISRRISRAMQKVRYECDDDGVPEKAYGIVTRSNLVSDNFDIDTGYRRVSSLR